MENLPLVCTYENVNDLFRHDNTFFQTKNTIKSIENLFADFGILVETKIPKVIPNEIERCVESFKIIRANLNCIWND